MDAALPNPDGPAPTGPGVLPERPAEIFNCPGCGRWLEPGTLICPDCDTIVYANHLRDLAIAATGEESSGQWSEARGIWASALAWLPAGTKQYAAVEQRISLIDTRLNRAAESKAKWTRRLGPFAPIVYFLAKFKTLFFLLTKAKFLFSFLFFFGIYWVAFGWKFALGITVSILVHEMGHYIAIKRRGLKVDLPVFMPGLGAYVRWYSQGISLVDLSSIALAGPAFGLLAALVCATIARLTGETFAHPGLWSALAYVNGWLNIVNLTPIFGLDGAQATFSLDRTQRWLVLASALIFFGWLHEWPYLLVAGGMIFRLFGAIPAERPSTRTLVNFVLLLFALGLLVYAFPAPQGTRY
jgi:Zn-dependent protease